MAVKRRVETLRARVREGSGRSPIDPWAFTPDGLDWRWIAGVDAQRQLERLCDELVGRLGDPSGAVWGYRARPRIATLLLDLALLSCGASVRVRAARSEMGSEDEATAEIEVVDASPGRVESGWSFRRRPAEQPPVFSLWLESSSASEPACSGDGWGPESVEAIARAVAPVGGDAREVVVLSADLSRRVERYAFLWALEAGASLVICRGEEVPAAVGWARPTTLWMDSPTSASLDAALRFCGGASQRSKQRALRRLKRLVALGGGADPELVARCAALGVELHALE